MSSVLTTLLEEQFLSELFNFHYEYSSYVFTDIEIREFHEEFECIA